jgi:hypothetical protein
MTEQMVCSDLIIAEFEELLWKVGWVPPRYLVKPQGESWGVVEEPPLRGESSGPSPTSRKTISRAPGVPGRVMEPTHLDPCPWSLHMMRGRPTTSLGSWAVHADLHPPDAISSHLSSTGSKRFVPDTRLTPVARWPSFSFATWSL